MIWFHDGTQGGPGLRLLFHDPRWGGPNLKDLGIHLSGVIHAILQPVQKGFLTPFWPIFGDNKIILEILQCWNIMRNLRKHRGMFSETSHHRKFPFWAKTYLIWIDHHKGEDAVEDLRLEQSSARPPMVQAFAGSHSPELFSESILQED